MLTIHIFVQYWLFLLNEYPIKANIWLRSNTCPNPNFFVLKDGLSQFGQTIVILNLHFEHFF